MPGPTDGAAQSTRDASHEGLDQLGELGVVGLRGGQRHGLVDHQRPRRRQPQRHTRLLVQGRGDPVRGGQVGGRPGQRGHHPLELLLRPAAVALVAEVVGRQQARAQGADVGRHQAGQVLGQGTVDPRVPRFALPCLLLGAAAGRGDVDDLAVLALEGKNDLGGVRQLLPHQAVPGRQLLGGAALGDYPLPQLAQRPAGGSGPSGRYGRRGPAVRTGRAALAGHRAPIAISTSRQWCLSTATNGIFSSAAPAARRASAPANAAWNTGDSSTESRTHSPTTTSTPESRNGTRHPQDANAASDSSAVITDSTPVANNCPAGAPVCGQDAQNPRRRASPCSDISSTAPPHSPPHANPWTRRSTVSSTGAAVPTVAWVGSSPIANVAPPLSSRLSTSSFLRPSRSP